jgi:hypothetical protein
MMSSMFLATALLYPCVLAVLCAGTGLLVERASGGEVPLALLIPVGAAGLIAVSQLVTFAYPLAPATPYAMVAVALAGFGLARSRARALAGVLRAHPSPIGLALLVYALALAPVLAAGRPSLSSYMALADSAVHLAGADFLIGHGQHFAHLDLHNSYGQFINDYYNASYPSGADTLFGGSALLLRLPLIWAFQPFNAFMLAAAVGPAWLIARRLGLTGVWALVAALAATLPALVYAYELLGSVKEITVLPLILSLGVLVERHRSWLRGGAARVLPFAILVAGGVSALGVAFGVWALAAALVPAVLLAWGAHRDGLRWRVRAAGPLVGVGACVLAIAALPTWSRLRGSVAVAQGIASTSNPGNLRSPLRASQLLGVRLAGSYKLAPHGLALTLTNVLIVVSLAAAVLGAWQLLRTRSFALAGWVGLSLLAWVAITLAAGTWAGAKALMLTSPVVVLLAWGGVAALRSLPRRILSQALAAGLAVALAGGVLVSDALQYHAANLAPTARYDELASLDARFAGQGPALFTDFDEYALYELRHLDVGGPDFVYPPPALAALAGGYGQPVRLEAAAPAALAAYPMIITRRDPAAGRPPAAYGLAWQGAYYQVWRRRPGATPALRHIALGGSAAGECRRIGVLAELAAGEPGLGATQLTLAEAPALVRVRLGRALHPRDWGHERSGLVMNHAGTLAASLRVPRAGRWDVWLRGQLMASVRLAVDGRTLATVGGQLSGNSLVPNAVPPIAVDLSAGVHRLTLSRGAPTLAPGDGGAAVIDQILLAPAGAQQALRVRRSGRWRSLCGRSYAWVELARTGGSVG